MGDRINWQMNEAQKREHDRLNQRTSPLWRHYLVNWNTLAILVILVILYLIIAPAFEIIKRVQPDRPTYRNMRSFHPALTSFYAEQYRFPEDPAELVEKDYLPAKTFVNSRVWGEGYQEMLEALPYQNLSDAQRKIQAGWVRSRSDYVFLWKRFERCVVDAEDLGDQRGKIIVAHERLDLPDGVYVLYGDGHVRWVMKDEIEALLIESELVWQMIQMSEGPTTQSHSSEVGE